MGTCEWSNVVSPFSRFTRFGDFIRCLFFSSIFLEIFLSGRFLFFLSSTGLVTLVNSVGGDMCDDDLEDVERSRGVSSPVTAWLTITEASLCTTYPPSVNSAEYQGKETTGSINKRLINREGQLLYNNRGLTGLSNEEIKFNERVS